MKRNLKSIFFKEGMVPQGSSEDRPLHGAPVYYYPTGRSLPNHFQDVGGISTARKWNEDDGLIDVGGLEDTQEKKKRWYQKEQKELFHNAKRKLGSLKTVSPSEQQIGAKPKGLWYSCGHHWLRWVESEWPTRKGKHNYKIKLDYSKILRITNFEELNSFIEKYGKTLFEEEPDLTDQFPDWREVAKDFSGIEICPYVDEARTEMAWYSGWDVASGCVWDSSAIKQIEPTEISKRDMDKEWDEEWEVKDEKSVGMDQKGSELSSEVFRQGSSRHSPTNEKLSRTKGKRTTEESKGQQRKIDWSKIEKRQSTEALHPQQVDHGLFYYYKDSPNKPIAGVTFATVDWEDNEKAHINMIGVSPNWRGSGLGKALVRDLAREYGYNNVEWGMTTDEGEHLRQSMEKEMEPYRNRGYDMWGKTMKEMFLREFSALSTTAIRASNISPEVWLSKSVPCKTLESKNIARNLWNSLKEYYPHDPAVNYHETEPGIEGEFYSMTETYYHGTNKEFAPGDYILPPSETGELSEKGRKKNLDKVFFTLDKGSANIYAGRAVQSAGNGRPNVYKIQPIGSIEWLNKQKGTTVLMAPTAKVIEKVSNH